jgi:hypothetical protein
MKQRSLEAAVLPILFVVPASVGFGIAAWIISLVVIMRPCEDGYGDSAVAIFGNHHWGTFATIVPWLPVVIGAAGLCVPWLMLISIERWLARRRVAENTLPEAT